MMPWKNDPVKLMHGDEKKALVGLQFDDRIGISMACWIASNGGLLLCFWYVLRIVFCAIYL